MDDWKTNVSPVWISLLAGAGAFAVSLTSIYLGYKLFVFGATGAFKFDASGVAGVSVGLESVAPGVLFALFGALVACYALRKLMGKN